MTDTIRIDFPYPGLPPLFVPRARLLAVAGPRRVDSPASPEAVIAHGLARPIGTPRLKGLASRARSALVLVDDNTRLTPARTILPLLLEELAAGGLTGEAVSFMVAGGTHRPMTAAEKAERFGAELCRSYQFLDHAWDDAASLIHLESVATDIPILINRAILEADLLIGLGHIVPHPLAGFSGGGKIVQPGVCGAETTAATHWQAVDYSIEQITGVADNPVRRQIEAVARFTGLAAVVNAVQDGAGTLARVVAGDIVEAHRTGAATAASLYSAPLPGRADIVVADSFPADIDMWQATKGLNSAAMAVRPGGAIVLVTPCPEGVSGEHPELAEFGYRLPEEVRGLVAAGQVRDQVAATEMAYTGRIVRERAHCILVSPGLTAQDARRLGLEWAASPQEGLARATAHVGSEATVTVLQHGGELLPRVGRPFSNLQPPTSGLRSVP